MNYTEKYHLPQWEETDRIMRVDFNEAMAGIEEGMTAAQTSADAAAVLPYVIGKYTGNGTAFQTIELDFAPRALLIAQGYNGGTDVNDDATSRCTFCTINSTGGSVMLNGKSFHVGTTKKYPNVNRQNTVYVYIAFR